MPAGAKHIVDLRAFLHEEIPRRRSNLKQCSLVLGKPAGWLGRFVREGRPAALTRAQRQTLGRFLNSPELLVDWHWQDADDAA